jgi:acyl carrier protein
MTTASTDQVRDFIFRVLIDQMNFPIDSATVDDGISLGPEGLDLQSLDLIELTLAVETEYSVKIPDEELEYLKDLELGAFVADLTARIS